MTKSICVTLDKEAELKKANAELVKALREAAVEIETWGAYASDYFQEKHDLEGCVKNTEAIADKYGVKE